MGLLTQKLKDSPRPIAWFSKRLDRVTSGWPCCLAVVAATTVLLVEEASKLTLGQHFEVLTPYQLQRALETEVHQWVMGSCLLKYQALLLDTSCHTQALSNAKLCRFDATGFRDLSPTLC